MSTSKPRWHPYQRTVTSRHRSCAWTHRTPGPRRPLRALEDENGRLKRLVADLSLDREMLKAVIAKNGLSS